METPTDWRLRFFTIWIGQAFSLFGSSLAGFGIIWWMTQSTGSATVLALGVMMTLLPGVVLGPFAGALVDRWDRRVVMLSADIVSGIAAAVLMVLFWSGQIQVWHIYTFLLVRGLAGTFHFPALLASTSLLVPHDQLTRIAGLNQMLQGASSIAAPPLAALLITIIPFQGLLAIEVGTAVVAVLLMAVVRIPRPPRAETSTSVMTDVREGLRYIWNWPGLRLVMIFACVINMLMTPAFSLMPILVTRHFNGNALQLAGMETGMGVGIIIGGVLLGVWGGFKRKILTAVFGLFGMSVATAMIGSAPASLYVLGVFGMALMGIMSSLTNGPFFAIMQSVVAPDLQGRVFTVMGSASSAMAPLGLALAGPVADRIGVQSWYVLGAIACLVLMVAFLRSPAVMRLEEGSGQTLVESGIASSNA